MIVAASINLSAQSISGTINSYLPVTSNSGCNSVTVPSTAGLRRGDRVLLIQMKGATIERANVIGYGSVTDYNGAGRYEFATIAGFDGNNVVFSTRLVNSYSASGRTQLVRVPRYHDVHVDGTLSGGAWDGSTGGVIALEATGTVTLNANINGDGLGFKGAPVFTSPTATCQIAQDYFYDVTSGMGAAKGEGIAEVLPGSDGGRGPLASGGGGGNNHNAGGGGGGNYGSGGGGGMIFSGCPDGDPNVGGLGGYWLVYSNVEGRIFLGGAGGAGHDNNNGGSGGANGGGIVIIRAARVVGGGRTISANGDSQSAVGGGDGQGGGGGGGSIILDVGSFITPLRVEAEGGSGGSTAFAGLPDGNCTGPGGGGGGGLVWSRGTLPAGVTTKLQGGAPGVHTNPANPTCFNSPRGATGGNSGGTLTGLTIDDGDVLPFALGVTGDTTICEGRSVRIGATGGISYRWTPAAGLDDPSSESPVAVPDSSTTYEVMATTADGCILFDSIRVTLQPAPDFAILLSGPTEFCEGDSIVLRAGSGYRSYSWTTTPPRDTDTLLVRSSGSYSVVVVDSIGCSATIGPVSVTVHPRPRPVIIPGGPITLCYGDSISLDAGAGYTSYRWSSLPDTTQHVMIYRSGEYRVAVTDSNGCSGMSAAVGVEFREKIPPGYTPPDTVMLCPGDTIPLVADSGYVLYRWSSGDSDTGRTLMVSIPGRYVVELTNSNGCTGPRIFDVLPYPAPAPPAITRHRDTLISSPAAGYQWHRNGVPVAGATTRTITVIDTASYIVTVADTNGCRASSPPYTRRATSSITIASYQAAPGESISVALEMVGSYNLAGSGVERFTTTIRFNGTMLVPLGSDFTQKVDGHDRFLTFTAPLPPLDAVGAATLARLEFMAVVGDAASTALHIESFEWSEKLADVISSDGEFHLTGICTDGGARLIDASGKTLLKAPRPNPAFGGVTFEYEVVESGQARLYLVDMLGVVTPLVDGVIERGRYQVAFDATGMAAGRYICVLETATMRLHQALNLSP